MKGVKHALTEAVSHHLHSAEAKVRSQAGTCQICGGQSNNVTRVYRICLFHLSISFHQRSILILTFITDTM